MTVAGQSGNWKWYYSSFSCYKERLLWMFESSLVCLEILADLTSFTSNSNDGFVRVFSVAAAPQKWSCLMQLKSSHFVQKSRPTSLSVRPNVMLQSILQSANHVYKVKSFTDKSDPKHCCYSVVFVCLEILRLGCWFAFESCALLHVLQGIWQFSQHLQTWSLQVLTASPLICCWWIFESSWIIQTSMYRGWFLGLVRSIHQKHRDVRKTCCFGGCMQNC